MESNYDKNKLIKNSVFLYIRMLVTVWLNLYVTRMTLENLGVENLGVYGVVGSVVSLFTILNNGITIAIQRFLSIEIGLHSNNVNKVFCSSLNVIIIISAVLVVALEIVGIWILKNKLEIPPESFDSAVWVYHLSVLSFVFNLFGLPYNALVVAHEKMVFYAFITVLQVILTFGATYSLCFWNFSDRLVVYGFLMTIVAIVIRLVYQVYCRYCFSDSEYHFLWDKDCVKSLFKFVGTSALASTCNVGANQGVIFFINIIYGVSVNAAYSISLQFKNMILSFGMNFTRVFSPQITKTYASGELENYLKIVYGSSKLTLLLMLYIALPVLFYIDYIMLLWLKEVPQYVSIFSIGMLLITIMNLTMQPIQMAVIATNQIKSFYIIPESLRLLYLPGLYICNLLGYSPIGCVFVIVVVETIANAVQVYICTKKTIVTWAQLVKKICFPFLKVLVFSLVADYFVSRIFDADLLNFIIFVVINAVVVSTLSYYLALSSSERSFTNSTIKRYVLKYI